MKFVAKIIALSILLSLSYQAKAQSGSFEDPIFKETDQLPSLLEDSQTEDKWLNPSTHHISFMGGKKFISLYDSHLTINEMQISYYHHFYQGIPWLYWDITAMIQGVSRFSKTYNFPLYGNIEAKVNDMTGGGLMPKIIAKPRFWNLSPFVAAGYRANYFAGTIEVNPLFATTQAALYNSVNGKELAMISMGPEFEAGLSYHVSHNAELSISAHRSIQQFRYPELVVNEFNQVYLKDSGWKPYTLDSLMLGFTISLDY